MKVKDIIELVDFISKSGLYEVKIETDEIKLAIKKEGQVETRFVESIAAPQQTQVAPQQIATPQQTAPVVEKSEESTITATPVASTANQITVKSPMIGTFYRRPNPDTPNFVEVGDEIKNNTTVCVIEAMKLFNEIEAEVSGRIVKVLVEDATPVEYDQPLFIVETI